ncbi:uncharacterized protein J4E87_007017 [Alternaria ethzedia]|uniref:uncharacterized protein n=1 Tax=Alternaria ethzedia TaxID=181014 RepID=UPI0020C1EE5D|nr:uncharacterized protein J4E87_007017 [Alternaria ethzedia]KAI4620691.1 hypothetical protein J4E87_007017 [Alternaria ethzedia]
MAEFFKRMRFGPPPYDDAHKDDSSYALLVGCEPEDNFAFYEKKEPEVGLSDEVSTTAATVRNTEAGKSEESATGKEEEDAIPTEEDSEAEEDMSEAAMRYFEGLQSNSEPEDFMDMRMNLIYECIDSYFNLFLEPKFS